jgi:hypothetical protein
VNPNAKLIFGPNITANALCAYCQRRYVDHDIPLDGWIEVKRCSKCPPLRGRDMLKSAGNSYVPSGEKVH